jgi:hypothetical protein
MPGTNATFAYSFTPTHTDTFLLMFHSEHPFWMRLEVSYSWVVCASASPHNAGSQSTEVWMTSVFHVAHLENRFHQMVVMLSITAHAGGHTARVAANHNITLTELTAREVSTHLHKIELSCRN